MLELSSFILNKTQTSISSKKYVKIEDINILQFNQYQKSDSVPCIIFPDFESLIRGRVGCKWKI